MTQHEFQAETWRRLAGKVAIEMLPPHTRVSTTVVEGVASRQSIATGIYVRLRGDINDFSLNAFLDTVDALQEHAEKLEKQNARLLRILEGVSLLMQSYREEMQT